MRILVATVGTGRDRKDVAGAIALSTREHRADRLVCLTSEKTEEETLPEVRALLADNGVIVEHRTVAAVDDVQALFGAYRRILAELAERHPTAELMADFTSGTKPMSAALFAAAVAQRVGSVSYVVGERDETGRAVGGGPMRTFRLTPDLVTADEDLRLARRLFNAGDYHAARELARRYARRPEGLPDGELKNLARAICKVADAHWKWERFDWSGAAHDLSGWNHWLPAAEAPWGEKLEEQRRFLVKCAGDKRDEWPAERVADLAANAQRRLRQGQYDDGVARCYRAIEYLAQWKLARDHGIANTGKVPVERIPEGLRAVLCRKEDVPEIKVGLQNAYRLLEARGDPLGAEFHRRYAGEDRSWEGARGELANLLQARNQSWLAHGRESARRERVGELLAQVRELAGSVIPGFDGLLATAEHVRWPLPEEPAGTEGE